MASYNLKVYHYVGGQQIRIYKKPIITEKEEERKHEAQTEERERNPFTGEIIEFIWDEFTDEKTVAKEVDKDRSAYVSASRTIQKIYEITRSNKWEYFITLTFNPKKVDSLNYCEVVKKLSKWIENTKIRSAPNLRYLLVPELHKSGRYHFHGLFSDMGNIELVDSGLRTDACEVIYNVGDYSLGFTTATRIKDNSKVSSYITKYISKELCTTTRGKKRYWASRNLNKLHTTEYNISAEKIEQLLVDLNENIVYAKTVECEASYNVITYLEVVDKEF